MEINSVETEKKKVNFKGAGLLGVLTLLLVIPLSYFSLMIVAFSSFDSGSVKKVAWLIFLVPLSFLIASIGFFMHKRWAFFFFIAPIVLVSVRIFLLD